MSKTRTKKILKCKWVLQQTCQAAKTGKVIIRSGQTIPVWLAFRCLYCGEYFNQRGAEGHFGTKRIDYNHDYGDGVIKEAEMITITELGKSDIR